MWSWEVAWSFFFPVRLGKLGYLEKLVFKFFYRMRNFLELVLNCFRVNFLAPTRRESGKFFLRCEPGWLRGVFFSSLLGQTWLSWKIGFQVFYRMRNSWNWFWIFFRVNFLAPTRRESGKFFLRCEPGWLRGVFFSSLLGQTWLSWKIGFQVFLWDTKFFELVLNFFVLIYFISD